jgi:hypothetical protein
MHRTRLKLAGALAASAVPAILASPTLAANIVTNGDFGTGDFTGWTLGGDSSGDFITSGQLTGSSYQAALTTNADDNGQLSQSLMTSPGQTYQLSYLFGGDGATPNSFSSSLGGSTLSSLSDIGDTIPTGTSYTFDYTATTASTALQFTYDDAPGYLYLTNVSVTPVTLPEPSSIAAAMSVAAGLGLLRRRRKAASA